MGLCFSTRKAKSKAFDEETLRNIEVVFNKIVDLDVE